MIKKEQRINQLQMFTTGRAVLIGDSDIILSRVFYGGLYISKQGAGLVSELSQVYSERGFEKIISKLSRREYGYLDSVEPFVKIPANQILHADELNFVKLNYELVFGADWIYIKNISNNTIHITCRDNHDISLEPFNTTVSRVGQAVPYPIKSVINTKDTIQSIVLFEKFNPHGKY